MFRDFGRDLRFAVRALTAAPGFSLGVTGSLVLGIVANITAFSFLNAAVFRPFPGVRNQHELVAVHVGRAERFGYVTSSSYEEYLTLRASLPALDDSAAQLRVQLVVTHKGESSAVNGALVSAGWFDVLGVRPAAGRSFLTDESHSPVLGFPDDVSRDGQFVLAHLLTTRAYDIGAYPLAQSGRERAVLPTPFNEVQARFSPDGKWVAHASDESGRFEVYVRPFPFSAERTLVSTAGGMQPEWRRDGKELFFISDDWKMMTVSVSADGTKVTAGTPRALFAVDVAAPNPPYPVDYAVSADGQRFLVNSIVDEPTRQTLTVILNWQPGLKE